MQEPATAQWGLSISAADLKKLQAGFEPQDQDDKWHVTVNNPSQGSNIAVHLARSGTDKKLYGLDVRPSNGDGGKIESVTWEQNKSGIRISEEQAKKEVAILCRRVLECDFDRLPEYDVSEMWNHPAAQLDAQ